MITEFYSQIKHYLLITLSICFISGLTLSFHLPSPSAQPLIVLGICALLTLLLVFLGYHDAAIILLGVCFLITGYWQGCRSLDDKPADDNVVHLIETPQEAVLIGTLARMVTGSVNENKIIIDSAFLRKKDHHALTPVSGKVLLKSKDAWPKMITPGDQLIVRAFFRKPSPAKTAGLFDYAQYLADRNIYLIGTIHSPLLIHEIDSPLYPGRIAQFSYATEKARTVISDFLSTALPEKHAALYRALLLGDRSSISPDLLEIFKRTGVMHILAISGMHMALLGFFLFSLFYYLARLSSRLIQSVDVRKLSLLLCIGPLLIYTLLAGSNTPVLRSLIMSLMFILAFCVNRPKSHLTILAAAALIIAVFDPQSIKSPSYQLSFSAVTSIILLIPGMLSFMPSLRRNDPRNNLLRYITHKTFVLAAVTVSATAGTLPLLIYHFHQFSTVSLPANLLVEPLVCLWTLPCGFLSIPFMFIHPPLAEAILTAGAWSLDIVSTYIGFLSTAPLSVLWLPDLNILLIVFYYAALVLAVSTTSKHLQSISYVTIALTLALFFVPLSGLNNKFQSSNAVSFIDVGQGSSGLLQLAGGRTIVIDAGATTAPGFNCGEKIIAPYLWSQGVGRIDDVILTHADADHYNGIPALFERFRPLRLWLPEQKSEKTGYQKLISDALQHDIEIKYPQNGVFIAHGHSTLSIIGDDMPDLAGKEKQRTYMEYGNNDSGLVVSLKTPEFSVLFPGDISSAREQTLTRSDRMLRHDILLSPHHGSSTSNSQGFLESVKPAYMVVSAGSGRSGLFPATATKESAEMLGIRVLTTGYEGTVTVVGNNGGFEIRSSADRK